MLTHLRTVSGLAFVSPILQIAAEAICEDVALLLVREIVLGLPWLPRVVLPRLCIPVAARNLRLKTAGFGWCIL